MLQFLSKPRQLAYACGALAAGGLGCTPVAHPVATSTLEQNRNDPAANTGAPATEQATQGAIDLGPAPGARPLRSNSVTLWLDSNSETLSADGKWWLAARFDIPPGSHIYWSNPGESGLATLAEFQVPAGFAVGPVRYPGPQRFVGERNTTSYGYAQQAALLVELTVPATVGSPSGAPSQLQVSASWLACSDVCAKESASARLAWPPPVKTVAQALRVTDFVNRLPTPLPLSSGSGFTSERQLRLVTDPEITLHEFFPDTAAGVLERDCTHQQGRTGAELLVQLPSPPPRPLHGVVRATRQGAERYYSVQLP